MSRFDSIWPLLCHAKNAVEAAQTFTMARNHDPAYQDRATEKLKALRDALNGAGADFTMEPAAALLKKTLEASNPK